MVIRNVNVIPMTREIVLENHNVIIADGVILGVLPPDKMNQVDLPESTSYIDGTGKYLTPGFSDMHSHSSGFEEVNKLMLANGITLARDMNGSSEALEARRLMEDKVYLGPELFITTPILDGDPPFWYANYILDDPALVEDVILALLDEGYNGIKVYEHLKEDVYQEIIRVADARDVQVFGHIPVAVGIELAIDSGQDSIEHFNGYYPSSLSDELFKATIKSGVWHCPTLVVMEKYANVHIYDQKLDRGEEIPWLCYVPDEFIEYWRCSGSVVFGLEIYKDFLLKLY